MTTPFDFFERTYVVNLGYRRDRRRDTEAVLRAAHAPVERVHWWPATRGEEPHGFPSAGAYGCFQSHLGVLSDARDAGLGTVLVLEDDVAVATEALSTWPRIQAHLTGSRWDLLNLGYIGTLDHDAYDPHDLHDGEPVRITTPLKGAHGYAVHGRVLAEFIAFLHDLQTRDRGDPAGGKMHYDGAINVFCRQRPEVTRLAVVPKLLGQRSSRSDIASLAWYDRTPVSRTLATRARDLRNARRRRSES